jgi:predicted MFS family arabinose efflux permease
MAFIALITAIALPRRVPTHQATYVALIGSVFALARRHPVLRQRSLYQGLLFASFSLFWTLAPIELMRHHGFSQVQVAIFALVGAVGAVAAPIAGRLADAGHGRRGTLVALLLAPVSLLIAALPGSSYIWLVVCAVLLDFAVQLNMVLGQREVYAIDPHSRARLNAVYMTSIFVGGALGSLVASPLYEQFGWHLSAVTVALLPALALAMFLGRKANA